MEGIKKVLLAVLLTTLFAFSMQKEYLTPETEICRLFKDGVKLRKPGTCSQAIVCRNFTSVPFKDCGKQVWDKNSEGCVKSSSDKYCTPSCPKNAPQYVADQKNCNEWFQCSGVGKVISKGKCTSDLVFDQNNQVCVYPDQSECVASYEFCDVVPNGVAFQDEYNCHKYLQCNKNVVVSTCETGNYFEVKLGKCVPKAQVACKKHPFPTDVCGNHKLTIRNRFVGDGATCCGYFYCQELATSKPDPDPRWDQCKNGLFFDAKQGACAPSAQVKCDEDRCDGRGNGKALSSQRGCQHYLICENSITVEEKYCGNDLYFDVTSESCTRLQTSYVACT